MLAIRLPEDVEKRLDDLARRTGRTKTFYAREAILAHLGDLEGLYKAGKTSVRTQNGHIPQAASSGASFVSRWQGRLLPAARADERYDALAKKYL